MAVAREASGSVAPAEEGSGREAAEGSEGEVRAGAEAGGSGEKALAGGPVEGSEEACPGA